MLRSGMFWLEARLKLIIFIKLLKQFGLARRSGTFSKIPGPRAIGGRDFGKL